LKLRLDWGLKTLGYKYFETFWGGGELFPSTLYLILLVLMQNLVVVGGVTQFQSYA
jgi:hypothetical protein